MNDIMKLCDTVRETAFAIHCHHKHGHLEKVYENGLAHRLRKLGLDVKQQHPLTVYDEDGTVIGQANGGDSTGSNRLASWFLSFLSILAPFAPFRGNSPWQ